MTARWCDGSSATTIARLPPRSSVAIIGRCSCTQAVSWALRPPTISPRTCFVSALAHLDSYDSERASFRTWLYRIATNKVIDRVRSDARRGVRVSLDDVDHDGFGQVVAVGDASELALDRVTVGRFMELLGLLAPRDQQVVRLRLLGELPFREVSVHVGMTEAAAKSSYHRVLVGLRAQLGGLIGDA